MQFYPTLLPVATRLGTQNPVHVAETKEGRQRRRSATVVYCRKPPSIADAAQKKKVRRGRWRGVILPAFARLYWAVQAGKTVYIRGGGNGVGHLAVQMARAPGPDGLSAAAARRNRSALARQSGAHHVLDYERDDLPTEIASRNPGFHHIATTTARTSQAKYPPLPRFATPLETGDRGGGRGPC